MKTLRSLPWYAWLVIVLVVGAIVAAVAMLLSSPTTAQEREREFFAGERDLWGNRDPHTDMEYTRGQIERVREVHDLLMGDDEESPP